MNKALLLAMLALPALMAQSRGKDASASPSPHQQSSCRAAMDSAMAEMHHSMQQVKLSDNFDADFVRLMLPHHQAALGMAKAELLCGNDATAKRLAQEIITDQQSEMDLMNLWLAKHQGADSAPGTKKEKVQ
ncbi:MAG: hypothetical protein NVS9B5_35520 [Terriglobales bacterium]